MLFSVDGYRLLVMPVFVGIGKKDGEAEASTEATEGEAPTEMAEAVAEGEAQTEVETEDGSTELAEVKPRRKRKVREPVAVEA